MNISIIDYETNKVAVEISIEITDEKYNINSIINDDNFDQIPGDLMFIRTRWLTVYLSYLYNNEEIKNGIIDDIKLLLEHNIIYFNRIGGTYKINNCNL